MRKSLVVIIAVLMVFTFAATGCGGSGQQSGGSSEASDDATYTLNYSITSKSEHCINRAMRDFEAYVEEASDGRIQIEIYDAGALGSDRETCEAVAMGDQEMIASTPYTLNQVSSIPQWLFWDVPFSIDDKDVLYKFFEGDAVKGLIEETAEKSRIRVLGMGENGALCVNTMTQVKTPAEIAKLKLRAAEIRTTVDFFHAMGVQTSVISYSELYTAMQQGLMDGSSTSVLLAYMSGTADYAKYITMMRTGFSCIFTGINEDLYQSMSDGDKAIMDEAGKVFSESIRKYSDEELITDTKAMEDNGVTFYTLSDEEKEALVPYAEQVYDEWSVTMGDFWTTAMEDLKEIGYETPLAAWPK